MWRLLLLFTCLGVALSASPVVNTKYGKIAGLATATNYMYYGIPYAQAPIGDLRWEVPKEPLSWSPKTLEATMIQPGCPQIHCDTLSPPFVCPKEISEDCLFLNIWSPSGVNETSSLAVMVYLHGGNFVHMSGGSKLYDGSILTKKGNVIQVNVDYRMGALGFLVTGTSEGDATGNYGVLDQRIALKWVSENIKAFGGDPSRVTLFGQSAGAQSTMIHMASEESSALFHNAIIESSPFTIPYKSYSETILLGAHLAKLLNCTARDIKCLRTRSYTDITYAQFESRSKLASFKLLEAFEPWGPYVDGTVVASEPIRAFEEGRFQRKPILIGTLTQECRLFIYGAWNKPVDNLVYTAVITATHPNHIAAVLKQYPPNSQKDERDTMSDLATHYIFGCATRHVSREIVKYGISDIWVFVYDHAMSFKGWGNATFCDGYVCHGAEIPFVFQTAAAGGFKYTSDELKLSDDMISYWTNFAKTGNPSGNGEEDKNSIAWPRFHKENKWPFMHLQTPSSFIDLDYNHEICDFWDKVKYNQ